MCLLNLLPSTLLPLFFYCPKLLKMLWWIVLPHLSAYVHVVTSSSDRPFFLCVHLLRYILRVWKIFLGWVQCVLAHSYSTLWLLPSSYVYSVTLLPLLFLLQGILEMHICTDFFSLNTFAITRCHDLLRVWILTPKCLGWNHGSAT